MLVEQLRGDRNIDQAYQEPIADFLLLSTLKSMRSQSRKREISTRYLVHEGARDAGKALQCRNRCILCGVPFEDGTHIISTCL